MESLTEAMENVIHDIKSSFEDRAVYLADFRARTKETMENICRMNSELRSDNYNLIDRFKMEHQDMAETLRKKLSSDEKNRIKAARQTMHELEEYVSDLQSRVKKTMNEFATDFRRAHKVWMGRTTAAAPIPEPEVEVKKKGGLRGKPKRKR
jgi:hypothetical protein